LLKNSDFLAYKLGAIGFGHWFERLYAGMINSNQITLAKVIGVSPIEGKIDRLKKAGLDPDNYYIMEPDGPIPEEFFDDLDIVHVSNPNKFHAQQTLESFQHNKITITEKTWGSTKEEFYTVVDYVKKNGLENKSYLHLHYIHKLLTLELPSLLKRFTAEHGKISAIALTFFEEARDEDERRARWLFSMENGGLFMDWIHPFEIIYTGCLANSAKLRYVDLYTTKKEYGEDFPTGIRAKLSMEGGYFSSTAQCFTRQTWRRCSLFCR
jgi:predicted dehydrogenase